MLEIQILKEEGIQKISASIKPMNADHAEELLFIKNYGNDAGQIKAYIIKERVSGYAGKVSDGAGYQFYIPEGRPLDEILEEVRLSE